jgi:N-acetylmuramoyl-L-alanine amidase
MKVYLTSGHQIINGKGNGAFGVDGFDEAVEARKFVNDVLKFLKFAFSLDESKVLTDRDDWSLNTVINWIAKNTTKDCLSIDVHFNAFTNPRATGTEVLIANNHTESELKIAKDFAFMMSSVLRINNRGVKTEAQSARGKLGMLSGGGAKAKNILIEICFITNPDDVRLYRNNYWTLVEKFSHLIHKIITNRE